MRLNLFITSTLAASVLMFASCATPQLATNNVADDVYNTTAEAKVYKYSPPLQPVQNATDNPDYIASNPNYDMDYSSRIDRFYYGNSRPYFDNYYNFYGYNSWYNPYDFRLGFNIGFGYNPWYSRYDNFGYGYGYGYPYYSNHWGPYSYYNPWYSNGYYGNGYYGNGYYGNNWGGNLIVGQNENYRPRPTRGGDGSSNAGGRYNGTAPSRGDVNNSGRPTRAEGYNPTTNGTINRPTTTGSSSRPTASPSSGSRPTRESQAPPASRPTYTPPPTQQSSPPPSNTGSGSSGQSGSSSRPTRGGGRG